MLSSCLSVHLSVTNRYCIKMADPWTLNFSDAKDIGEIPPNGGEPIELHSRAHLYYATEFTCSEEYRQSTELCSTAFFVRLSCDGNDIS